MTKRFSFKLLVALAVFGLLAVTAPAQKRTLVAVPDLPGHKTLKCDFHMHTVFSDGEVWPTTRVMEAWRDGLDAISITDHDDYNPHKEDVKTDISRPYAIALPFARRAGIILIPGAEITKGDIHFNALFVSDPNVFTGLDLTSALTAAHKQGAFLFYNHPGWRAKPEWLPVIDAAHKDGMVHGVELVNGMTYYPEVFPWIASKNLAIIANTDVHTPQAAENKLGSRPVTLVFARTADPEGIREALTARRTVGWMGEKLWGSETLLRGLWEGAVKPLTTEVTQESRGAMVSFRNDSSITFEAQLTGNPSWITGKGTIHPRSVSAIMLRMGAAPADGPSSTEIELEITNAHVAPDQNLKVKVPLKIARN